MFDVIPSASGAFLLRRSSVALDLGLRRTEDRRLSLVSLGLRDLPSKISLGRQADRHRPRQRSAASVDLGGRRIIKKKNGFRAGESELREGEVQAEQRPL